MESILLCLTKDRHHDLATALTYVPVHLIYEPLIMCKMIIQCCTDNREHRKVYDGPFSQALRQQAETPTGIKSVQVSRSSYDH